MFINNLRCHPLQWDQHLHPPPHVQHQQLGATSFGPRWRHWHRWPRHLAQPPVADVWWVEVCSIFQWFSCWENRCKAGTHFKYHAEKLGKVNFVLKTWTIKEILQGPQNKSRTNMAISSPVYNWSQWCPHTMNGFTPHNSPGFLVESQPNQFLVVKVKPH